jgi:Zn-finger nucleic acid-binding protein
MYTCDTCNGLWVDAATLQRLVSERLKPSPMLGTGIAGPAQTHVKLEAVAYAPCPICKSLMNRVNFAHTSGVIVDVCTSHGTWFDADELRRVLEFISAGGLEAARARELRQTPQAPAAVVGGPMPMSSTDDLWHLMGPVVEQNASTTIIKALISFTSSRKSS